ncbi:MAG: lysophospholipid acyltransferase family protein [Lacunisphaera sp.]
MKLRFLYYLPAYWVTLLGFALGGLEVGCVSLLAGWLPATDETERFFQRYINFHFRCFHEWCALLNLVHVRYEGFERIPAGGLVLVANHVSLVDITCLLAQMPEALCIFKPAIRRNPVLGAGARRAGYLSSDGGHQLIRHAVEKVARGQKLVVFPEGTRAPGRDPLPFKPGFALIAQQAGAPIQLLRIHTDSDLLTKGRPVLKLPRFPAHVKITVGPLLDVAHTGRPEELTAAVEGWYRGASERALACAPVPVALS